ncbi:RNA 2',3'-cyclic phosphodiesterase [Shewanella sp. AS16]|uniref:RNA 2',3'-cyclic phosphodiesterase n=1 Tax=Shewanella sp. AS16 TaxID=2907625 RepID=UPI001F46A030|nr:RNA 2',3'-cyclic phosphodiesterase [Shewanella sp. AS16]MCE9685767.1 RNA 2',3'-cyclic phosphodiesterase [Shewanella sp. AS16]
MSKKLFLGFAPEPHNLAKLLRLQHELHPWLNRNAKPVAVANLHLTLAFLGQVPPTEMERLRKAVAKLHKPAFSLTLDRLRHWSGPKILCLSGEVADPGLAALASDSQRLCHELGLHCSEQAFIPHISLFRKVKQAPEPVPEPISLTPHKLHLYESLSAEDGVHYQIIESWELTSD